jgi:pimeloyl-ACP methyl ester carboxylesterase
MGENLGIVATCFFEGAGQDGQAHHECLPHAEWQTIPECGHLSMFEQEAAFVKAVANYCR